jgi:hypothetical protein
VSGLSDTAAVLSFAFVTNRAITALPQFFFISQHWRQIGLQC